MVVVVTGAPLRQAMLDSAEFRAWARDCERERVVLLLDAALRSDQFGAKIKNGLLSLIPSASGVWRLWLMDVADLLVARFAHYLPLNLLARALETCDHYLAGRVNRAAVESVQTEVSMHALARTPEAHACMVVKLLCQTVVVDEPRVLAVNGAQVAACALAVEACREMTADEDYRTLWVLLADRVLEYERLGLL